MDIENEELTFGRYLSSIRLKNGISLEEVEAKTNIGKSMLLIIEQEEWDKFPAPVYVKGFLRAYASAVDADGDEVIRRYDLGTGGFGTGAKSETEYLKAGKGFLPRLILTVIAVLMVVGASIYFMNRAGKTDQPEESALIQEAEVQEKSVNPPVPAPEPETSEEAAAVEPAEADKPGKIQVMKVVCVEDTWMKVITDGKKPVEYELKEGDAMTLLGEKSFNLLIGSGNAVKVRLNGKPVAISGKNGQAVSLEVP